VNTRIDPLNCGGCGNALRGNQVCTNFGPAQYTVANGCTATGFGATCAACDVAYGKGNYRVCPAVGSMKQPICVQGFACPG
jgi:hypothetical protein